MSRIYEKFKKMVQRTFPRKRTKQIEKWDFIMVFDLTQKDQIIKYFSNFQCLKLPHVKFQYFDYKQNQQFLVLVSMDQQIVISQAHELKILKIKNKKSFQISEQDLISEISKAQSQHSSHYADYLRFILVRYDKQNKQITEQQKFSVFNKYKIEKYQKDDWGDLFTPEEQLRCKYNFLLTYREAIAHETQTEDSFRFPFVDIMKKSYFQELVPIHKNSKYPSLIFDSLKKYIGSNEQTYFQFVSFLQKWLLFPAIIGLITTLFNYFFEFTADDSPGDFVYSLIIMFWSIYFITNWENESKWLKTKEMSGYNDEVWSEHQNILTKKGLDQRISRITGKFEYYLPLKKKLFYYSYSIGMCILISVSSLFFMILSLNSRGFVDPDHKLLYFEQISSWAAPGGIFDATTWWGQIPNLIHVIVTNGFDQSIYRPFAKKLTKIERHLNSKTHSDSIIMKYFIYEFIITFADFFYIAFVRFDIQGLREQLLSLFFIDIIRRLVAEALIPWLKNKYFSYSLKGHAQRVAPEKELRHYAIMEINKEHFESFDDYLEIITNFGYLVLISSCFPLAPLLILFAHSIEGFQDKYKLVHIFRRKLPQKFVGMGYWKDIIVFICYMSIVTNILLFAFSSKQIVSIFPQVFQGGKNFVLGNTNFTELIGGAATGMFSAMMTLGNNTIETVSKPIQLLLGGANSTLNFNSTDTYSDNGWFMPEGQNCTNDIHNAFFSPISNPPSLYSFAPVPKEHQIEFIGILFLLEHIFLIGFILLRNFLGKKKNNTDIFLERRAYKRKIKKYLSKDILAETLRDQIVGKLINQNSVDNPLGILGALFEKPEQKSYSVTNDSSNDSKLSESSISEQPEVFSTIFSKIVEKADSTLQFQEQTNSEQQNIQKSKES